MHQDDVVIFQVLPCTVDGVYIVRLGIQGVVDEGKPQGKVQPVAVVDKYLVVITRGHRHLFYTEGYQLPKLAAQDRVPERYLGHALRVLLSNHTHAVPEAAVKD